jgi:hypothetical protein
MKKRITRKQRTKLLRTGIQVYVKGRTVTKAEWVATIQGEKKVGEYVHIAQVFNYETKEFKNYLNGKLVKD